MFLPAVVAGMQGGDPSPGKKTVAASTPSAQDISNARAQGLVWVNLSTGVFWKEGQFYGKTKRGKFLSEDEARKQGFREAKEPTASKKIVHKKGDQSGTDATIETHSSTPAKPK
ncbi:MAG: hypothetical protein JO069_20405 [Verrucomicrobia bacterium]|nr:hypothetical protein [Verrucomicrobiota bacterium]